MYAKMLRTMELDEQESKLLGQWKSAFQHALKDCIIPPYYSVRYPHKYHADLVIRTMLVALNFNLNQVEKMLINLSGTPTSRFAELFINVGLEDGA